MKIRKEYIKPDEVVGHIFSLANDLAWKDPEAIGAVSTAPYMANAVTIYSEWLKGDNYERIDVNALDLDTIKKLNEKYD